MRIPKASELLNDIERQIFDAVWHAGWNARGEYILAQIANSSGLRGDGEPLESVSKPVSPYAPPP